MTNAVTATAQARAARLAGAMYLITMATAVFAAYFIRSPLIVRGNATKTAENIIESEQLFRIGIASDLVTFAGVIALTWALYVLLRPVNKHLALLGAFWRLGEATIMSVVTVNSLIALALLTDAEYLKAFDASQLHALARQAIVAQGAGYNIGFLFLGSGSTVFSYLLLKSGYVPKSLAAWGVASSLLMLASAFWIIVFPSTAKVPQLASFAAMFIYEVTLGSWLLLKGVNIQAVVAEKT